MQGSEAGIHRDPESSGQPGVNGTVQQTHGGVALAERSVGTPDAGALSFALCVSTAAAVLADTDNTARSN